MRQAGFLLASVGLAGAVILSAGSAHAETLAACGDFEFDPLLADCHVFVGGGCDLQCQPLAFIGQCSGDLYGQCTTECNLDVDVGCTGDCEASCNLECTPGEFDCYAYCEGGCTADCDTYCTGNADEASCKASCSASCEGDCQASCEVNPPDCQGGCQASCQGECHANANFDCQVSCQSGGLLQCEEDLKTSCKAQCAEPEGALFCYGRWVETSDLDACVQAIQDQYDIQVDGYVETTCTGNQCTTTAEGSASCAASPGSSSGAAGFAGVGLLGLAFAVANRMRRQGRRTSR
ncbi:MAG: hypothetical protein U0271_05005 [Polyangiaceae bacterium]